MYNVYSPWKFKACVFSLRYDQEEKQPVREGQALKRYTFTSLYFKQ